MNTTNATENVTAPVEEPTPNVTQPEPVAEVNNTAAPPPPLNETTKNETEPEPPK